MHPVLDVALIGMQAAMDQLVRTAERIAQLTEDGDLPRDIVELISLHRRFEANATVVRTANEMLGTLLDLFA